MGSFTVPESSSPKACLHITNILLSQPPLSASSAIDRFVKSINSSRPRLHASNFCTRLCAATPMDSSLHEVWQAAAGTPFLPAVGKHSQFFVGIVLLFIGLLLTGVFALNRSLVNVGLLGVPASLAIAFGTVYMFCAVGVYV